MSEYATNHSPGTVSAVFPERPRRRSRPRSTSSLTKNASSLADAPPATPTRKRRAIPTTASKTTMAEMMRTTAVALNRALDASVSLRESMTADLDRTHAALQDNIEQLRREVDLMKQCHGTPSDAVPYQHEMEAMRERIAQLEEESDGFCQLADESKKHCDKIAAECARWKECTTVLEAQLQACFHKDKRAVEDSSSGGQAIAPTSYAEIPRWVDKELADALVLLPRAVRAMTDAPFHDVGKVVEALRLLANEYRDMRMGAISKGAFTDKLASMKLHCTRSISKERSGEHGDGYFVTYPPDGDKRVFLDMHLRNNGNSRHPERCLAIYFFWDDKTKRVIVGWLPGHLDIRTS